MIESPATFSKAGRRTPEAHPLAYNEKGPEDRLNAVSRALLISIAATLR